MSTGKFSQPLCRVVNFESTRKGTEQILHRATVTAILKTIALVYDIQSPKKIGPKGICKRNFPTA